MPKKLDVTGQRYRRLVAICQSGHDKWKRCVWTWRCDCGAIIDKALYHVRNGDTGSCGCLRVDVSTNGSHNRKPTGESSFNGLYNSYTCRAKYIGKEWNIDKDLFRILTKSPCHYCGAPPSQEKLSNKASNGAYIYNGLDRVENDRGYDQVNVVPCCGVCNRAKSVMGREEFLLWVMRVCEFQQAKKTVIENTEPKEQLLTA